jgi:hypothetical protein
VRAEIPEDAFTASILGTGGWATGLDREDGLILTIGYLITEAQTIWLTTNGGVVVAGYPLAYDQVTGFGSDPTAWATEGADPPARLDRVRGSRRRGAGDRQRRARARAQSQDHRQTRIRGLLEYVLDEALFTAPAHPQWAARQWWAATAACWVSAHCCCRKRWKA